MKRIVIALALLLAFPSLAWADFQDGLKAAEKGDYATALREWKPLADKGDADVQYNIGILYQKGRGVAKSYSEAMTAAAKWYRKAADLGHAGAQYNLGLMYAKGQGVVQSDFEAIRWYLKAANQGYVSAQFNLGNIYHKGQGMIHYAVKWYRKAADQGHARAQYNLGVMYANGQGVAQSYSQAVKWYRKAADQGHADAQNNLGYMYAAGQGVPENYVQAYRWAILAAASGNELAKTGLNHLRDIMTSSQIAEAQRLAAGGKVGTQATGWSAISRTDIKLIQKALNDLGFSVGAADGIAGKRTKSALETFQRIKGLPVGNPDAATLKALGVR
jgi:uncharacterized protein